MRTLFGTLSKARLGTSLAVQWLRLCASTAGAAGSIPGQGTKILRAAAWPKKNKNKKQKGKIRASRFPETSQRSSKKSRNRNYYIYTKTIAGVRLEDNPFHECRTSNLKRFYKVSFYSHHNIGLLTKPCNNGQGLLYPLRASDAEFGGYCLSRTPSQELPPKH